MCGFLEVLQSIREIDFPRKNLYWYQSKYYLQYKPGVKAPVRNSYPTQVEMRFIDIFHIRSRWKTCCRTPTILLKEAHAIHPSSYSIDYWSQIWWTVVQLMFPSPFIFTLYLLLCLFAWKLLDEAVSIHTVMLLGPLRSPLFNFFMVFWASQITSFSDKEYGVIILDFLGYGDTSTPDDVN